MINIVTGPPFTGKDTIVRKTMADGDAIIDTTLIWRTLFPDWSGKVRGTEEASLVRLMMAAAVRKLATSQEITGWLVLAEARKLQLENWMKMAKVKQVYTIGQFKDEKQLMNAARRHARKAGVPVEECESIVSNFVATQELNQVKTIDFDTAFETRSDDSNESMERRVFLDDCELRVEEGKRTVTGIAVRYGDKGSIWGDHYEVVTGPEAIILGEGPENVTIQHNRDLPVGLVEWIEDKDALRFKTEIVKSARGDQALADIRGGLLRGASMEFQAKNETMNGKIRELSLIKVGRVSLVDKPSYPTSRIQVRCHACQDSLRTKIEDDMPKDDYKAKFESMKADYDKMKADYDKMKADYDKMKAAEEKRSEDVAAEQRAAEQRESENRAAEDEANDELDAVIDGQGRIHQPGSVLVRHIV